MISRISIDNFIIIENLEITLEPGFTTITGETGTGKSIILDAINFCFGRFSPKDVAKDPEKSSVVEIEFKIRSKLHLFEQDLSGTVVIKRILSPSGKSSYYLNGESVLYKELKSVIPYFLDITAQHDTILSESYQYDVFHNALQKIDESAEGKLLRISKLHAKLKTLEQEIEQTNKEIEEARRNKAYNQQVISELTKIDIKENEETNLLARRSEISRLASNNNLIKSSLNLLQSCFGNSLYQAIKNLERVNTEQTDQIVKRLGNIDIESSDILAELSEFAESLTSIESELAEIDDRLSLIRTLARKYNTSASTLFEFLESAKSKINLIENTDQKIQDLQNEIAETIEAYDKIAAELSNIRIKSAEKLTQKVSDNLKDLLLPNAVFKIEVWQNRLNRKCDGIDEIEFMASFNKEKAMRPISQIASGGEAARLNFALKISVGEYSNCDVIIFDEVDIGIGGSAAYAMGKSMKRFANQSDMQVISITHSPQIAAKSDTHLLVRKRQNTNGAFVTLNKLNEEDKCREIARMISGDVVNNEAILAAKRLITAL